MGRAVTGLSVCGIAFLTLPAAADPRPLAHSHLGGPMPSPNSHVVYHDLVYDESVPDPRATSLDIYAADPVGTSSPVIVFVHSGDFATGDKADADDLAFKPEYFTTRLGHVFVSINYRLLPDGQYPVNVHDTANALAWVWDNIADFGGDPGHIVVMGHAAGATLASLVATDARFLQSAGRDLTLLRGAIAIDSGSFFFDDRDEAALAALHGDDWRAAAPGFHVAGGKPIPTHLLLHITADVDPSSDTELQSNLMAAALREAGVRADVVALDHVDRSGVNARIGVPGDAATAAVERFLRMLQDTNERVSAR